MVAAEKTERRGSTAPIGSASSKLATLDWPCPPSPAGGRQRPKSWAGFCNTGVEAGLGATSPQEICADAEALPAKSGSEAKLRADLWAVRSEIEKEKLRHVAPFPFFGKSMRFQDESGSGALQISDDGRFSYSTVTIEGLEPGERPPSGEPQVRRVTTYEGILMPPPQVQGLDFFQAFSEQPVLDDGMSSIEGNAMAKYEVEDSGGRAKLVSVERGQFSFSITVSPYFQPSFCTVQPSPRKWPPSRKKQLPYVGTGLDKKKRDVPVSTKPSFACINTKPSVLMKAGDVRRLMQERRRAPKLKFSKSATQLSATSLSPFLSIAGKDPTRGSCAENEEAASKRASISKNRSSQLLESNFSTQSLSDLDQAAASSAPSAGRKSTVADWKAYYLSRSDIQIASSRDDDS